MARSDSARRREENEVEFARIVAFSDGVFAIAITLLVLNLGVSQDIDGGELPGALWDQRQDLFAYALSFAVIGRFWIIHHRFFGEITGFDNRLLALNLFYLAWIALVPFTSEVLGDYGGEPAAIVLYSANIAAVVLGGTLLTSDARRAGFMSSDEEEAARFRRRGLVIAGVFLLSIPVAFLDAHAAQFIWLVLFLDPVVRRVRGG
jgi:TMEM175 potassium channel family protein